MTRNYTRVPRVCETCGKHFDVSASQAARNEGRFCSRKCYSAKTEVDHITVNCAHCDKLFKTSVYRKRGAYKYCSKECAAESKKKQVDSICQNCGQSFSISVAQFARGEGKFCSRQCYSAATEVEYIAINCARCGKSFDAPVLRNGKIYKYCSRECTHKAHSGQGHHLWRGGRVRPYGLNWRKQRSLAYERDGGACQHCGLTEKQSMRKYGERNSVHHIVKRRAYREQGRNVEEANAVENLIVLCKSCHKRAEHSKIILQPKLL